MSRTMDLIERARDDAEQIAVAILGEPNKALSTPRELRWGEHGKLSLARVGAHRGKWRDWSDMNRHGDALDLIEGELTLDRDGALEWLSRWFGGGVPAVDRSKREAADKAAAEADELRRAERMETAGEIWRASLPFKDSPAERYLLGRLYGFQIPGAVYEGEALRWNPNLRTLKGEPVPGAIGAMVALMTNPVSGGPCGIHRTFINSALEKISRGMLGAKGVTRLWADDAVTLGLAVGEGIETTLSAVLLFDAPPAWAALDAGNLAALPVLSGIEALTIFSDNDKPDPKTGKQAGQAGARLCADRWLEAGREVTIRTPREGDLDFNDFLQSLSGAGQAA